MGKLLVPLNKGKSDTRGGKKEAHKLVGLALSPSLFRSVPMSPVHRVLGGEGHVCCGFGFTFSQLEYPAGKGCSFTVLVSWFSEKNSNWTTLGYDLGSKVLFAHLGPDLSLDQTLWVRKHSHVGRHFFIMQYSGKKKNFLSKGGELYYQRKGGILDNKIIYIHKTNL